mmetsp:Transcript_87958/g.138857  ORF Transcript_87958/g.138857 Transcript_87958/m.138857 type:complete len:224 (+) Transcript_87958:1584-2255(+)
MPSPWVEHFHDFAMIWQYVNIQNGICMTHGKLEFPWLVALFACTSNHWVFVSFATGEHIPNRIDRLLTIIYVNGAGWRARHGFDSFHRFARLDRFEAPEDLGPSLCENYWPKFTVRAWTSKKSASPTAWDHVINGQNVNPAINEPFCSELVPVPKVPIDKHAIDHIRVGVSDGSQSCKEITITKLPLDNVAELNTRPHDCERLAQIGGRCLEGQPLVELAAVF